MTRFIPSLMTAAIALSIASPAMANNFMFWQNIRNLNQNIQNQQMMERIRQEQEEVTTTSDVNDVTDKQYVEPAPLVFD